MSSLNAETPRQPTAVYTMYDFFSFRRRHISKTNLKRVRSLLEVCSCIHVDEMGAKILLEGTNRNCEHVGILVG